MFYNARGKIALRQPMFAKGKNFSSFSWSNKVLKLESERPACDRAGQICRKRRSISVCWSDLYVRKRRPRKHKFATRTCEWLRNVRMYGGSWKDG